MDLPLNTGRRAFGLDVLRVLAVSSVLVAHCNFPFLPLTGAVEAWQLAGHYGVELFFALSGYLLGNAMVRAAQAGAAEVRTFWLRRALRTMPAYYLFLFINWTLPTPDGVYPPIAPYFVFLQSALHPPGMFFLESWSLCVEEVFYLVAPLLMVPVVRGMVHPRRLYVLFGVVIACAATARVVAAFRYNLEWDAMRMVLALRLDAIWYGVAVAVAQRHLRWTPSMLRALAVAGVVSFVASIVLVALFPRAQPVPAHAWWFVLAPASFALVMPHAATWAAPGERVARLVREGADISYGLYLTQLVVLRFLLLELGWRPITLAGCLAQMIALVVLSVASAWLVRHAFEVPILRWRDRVFPQRAV